MPTTGNLKIQRKPAVFPLTLILLTWAMRSFPLEKSPPNQGASKLHPWGPWSPERCFWDSQVCIWPCHKPTTTAGFQHLCFLWVHPQQLDFSIFAFLGSHILQQPLFMLHLQANIEHYSVVLFLCLCLAVKISLAVYFACSSRMTDESEMNRLTHQWRGTSVLKSPESSCWTKKLHTVTGMVRVKAWVLAKKGHLFSKATLENSVTVISDHLKSTFRILPWGLGLKLGIAGGVHS